MWSQKSTRTSFVPRICQRLWMLSCFFLFLFFSFLFFSKLLHVFLKVVLWTHKTFFTQMWDNILKMFSLNIFFCFSTVNSKMSRNVCKLRHKVSNGHFYAMKVQISSIFNLGFPIKFLLFILGFQKHIVSIRLLKIH